jgi:hypothetical protein
LYLGYSWDTGFIRNGKSGSGVIFTWNKSFRRERTFTDKMRALFLKGSLKADFIPANIKLQEGEKNEEVV